MPKDEFYLISWNYLIVNNTLFVSTTLDDDVIKAHQSTTTNNVTDNIM